MLATVLLAVLCGQQVLGAATTMDDMHKHMETCMEETGTTLHEIFAWADGADANSNLKCQMKCVQIKSNWMTNSGQFLVENMLDSLPAEQHDVVTECVAVEQGGDLCELAYRNQMCMRDKSPDVYGDRIKMMATGAPSVA